MQLLLSQPLSLIQGGFSAEPAYHVVMPIVSSGVGAGVGATLGGTTGAAAGAAIGNSVGHFVSETTDTLVHMAEEAVFSDDVKSTMLAVDYLMNYLF